MIEREDDSAARHSHSPVDEHAEDAPEEGPVKAFLEYKFFEGLRVKIVSIFALAAKKRMVFGPEVILREGSSAAECDVLFVIDDGHVLVEEGGQVLGKLERGEVFGSAVAFDSVEHQPLTIKCESKQVILWHVPRYALRSTFRLFPEAKKTLEQRMEAQMRSLLASRLHRANFFSHCMPKFFSQLVDKMKVSFYKRNSQLITAHEPVEYLFVVAVGSVKVRPMRTDELSESSVHDPAVQRVDSESMRSKLQAGDVDQQRGGSCFTCMEGGPALKNAVSKQPSLSAQDVHELEDANIAMADNGETSLGGKRASMEMRPKRQKNSMVSSRRFSSMGPRRSRRASAFTAMSESSDDSDEEEPDATECWSAPQFALASCRAVLEPKAEVTLAVAGPEPLLFGDGGLLGFQSQWPCTVHAVTDCMCLVLCIDEFLEAVERHPRERKRYDAMRAGQCQEWRKCHIARLATIDTFSRCASDFLALIAKYVEPGLFFPDDIIISTGAVPKVLILLMVGEVEVVRDASEATTVTGPHSFGSLDWLGVSSDESTQVTAISLCQVLNLTGEKILSALEVCPLESTSIVSQVARHNGMRTYLSTGQREPLTAESRDERQGLTRAARMKKATNLWLGMWHMPFCEGLDPQFVLQFSARLELRKLVPGQCLFKSAEDPDVIVVLQAGRAHSDDGFPADVSSTVKSGKVIDSPLVIVSFNKNSYDQVRAMTVCSVHRIGTKAACDLAAKFPEETRCLLERLFRFQQRVDTKLRRSWWSPAATLRKQAELACFGVKLLQDLADATTINFFVPGEVIVEEGDEVDSAMIIESGVGIVEKVDTRSLYARDRVGQLEDGNWIGDIGKIAGRSKRKATIRAATICKVIKIMRDRFVALLGKYPRERERFRGFAEERLRTVDSGGLEEHDFFKTFDRRFLNLLRPRCRPHIFFAGEVLMRQGEPAQSLFILSADSGVQILVDGQKVKDHNGLACLGIAALLSNTKVFRTATVVCNTVCNVRKLSRADWLDALKSYPEHRRWIERFTHEQIGQVKAEADDFFKKRVAEKIKSRSTAATKTHVERQQAFQRVQDAMKRRREQLCASPQLPNLSPPPTNVCEEFSKEVGCFGGNASSIWSRTTTRSPSPVRTPRNRGVVTNGSGDSPSSRLGRERTEFWRCFNVETVRIPHARLPQLGYPPELQESLLGRIDKRAKSKTSSIGDAKASEADHFSGPRRSSCNWAACEEAFGLHLPPGILPPPPPGGAGGLEGAPMLPAD